MSHFGHNRLRVELDAFYHKLSMPYSHVTPSAVTAKLQALPAVFPVDYQRMVGVHLRMDRVNLCICLLIMVYHRRFAVGWTGSMNT